MRTLFVTLVGILTFLYINDINARGTQDVFPTFQEKEDLCNMEGQIFFDNCDDGREFFFLRTTDGRVFDPYLGEGLSFNFERGQQVKFGYEAARFNSPCSIAEQAIILTCVELVETSNEIFNDYPWLKDLVNPNNCSIETVAVYQQSIYNYLLISDANGDSKLYNQNGLFYCQNATNYDCVAAYNLGAPIAIWTCPLNVACSQVYAPVCGTNGTTYGTGCDRNAAGVDIAYYGECQTTTTSCQQFKGKVIQNECGVYIQVGDVTNPFIDFNYFAINGSAGSRPLIEGDSITFDYTVDKLTGNPCLNFLTIGTLSCYEIMEEEIMEETLPLEVGPLTRLPDEFGLFTIIYSICEGDTLTVPNPLRSFICNNPTGPAPPIGTPTPIDIIPQVFNNTPNWESSGENDFTTNFGLTISFHPKETTEYIGTFPSGQCSGGTVLPNGRPLHYLVIVNKEADCQTTESPTFLIEAFRGEVITIPSPVVPSATFINACPSNRQFIGGTTAELAEPIFPLEKDLQVRILNEGSFQVAAMGGTGNYSTRDDLISCPNLTYHFEVRIKPDPTLDSCTPTIVSRQCRRIGIYDENDNLLQTLDPGFVPAITVPLEEWQDPQPLAEGETRTYIFKEGNFELGRQTLSCDNSTIEVTSNFPSGCSDAAGVLLLNNTGCRDLEVFGTSGNVLNIAVPGGSLNFGPDANTLYIMIAGTDTLGVISAFGFREVDIDTKGCSESNAAIFDDYPWLSDLVNANNCSTENIAVYQQGIYFYLLVTDASGNSKLYNEVGQFYCQNSATYDCVVAFNFGAPVDNWTCTDNLSEDCFCPQVVAPVCGVDGNTYGNSCEAACAGVEIVFDGSCDDPPLTECTVTITNRECFGVVVYDENDNQLTVLSSNTNPNTSTFWEDTRPLAGAETRTYVFKLNDLELGRQTVSCANASIDVVNKFTDGCSINTEPSRLTNSGCKLLSVFGSGGGLLGRAFPEETITLGEFHQLYILMVEDDTIGVDFSFESRDIDTGGCPDTNTYNDVQIFEDYPWLSAIVDPNSCSGEKVEVWQSIQNITYLLVSDANGKGILYNESGQVFCQDSGVLEIDALTLNCFQAYELTELLSVWFCGSDDSDCNFNYEGLVTVSLCGNGSNDPILQLEDGRFIAAAFSGNANFTGQAGDRLLVRMDITIREDQMVNCSVPAIIGLITCFEVIEDTTLNNTFGECPDLNSPVVRGTIVENSCGIYIQVGDQYYTPEYATYGVAFEAIAGTVIDFEFIPIATATDFCLDRGETPRNIHTFINVTCLSIISEPATCANNTGTIFFENCDDGRLFYFVRTDDGRVYDPYIDGSTSFNPVEGQRVKFNFVDANFATPCTIAEKAISITCIELIEDGNTSTDNIIFSQFPWLNDIINPTACNGEVITVYQLGAFQYVYVESVAGEMLYFQDGTFYCMDAPNYDCRAAYNLNEVVDTWNCGTSLLPESKERSRNQLKVSDFIISPNPTTDQFTIQVPAESEKDYQVQVIDLLGRIVYQTEIASSTIATTVDLADYQNGVYYVELRAVGIRSIKKLVKQGLE